jgi:3'-5' exonuclease
VFKMVAEEIWIFDAEWVPDPDAGRAAYDLPATLPDHEVLEHMWREGGATPEDPRPYLKTVLCRVVSIAAVVRKRIGAGPPQLTLFAVPQPGEEPLLEATLLERFLAGIGRTGPQLVGYNSHNADLVILFQRAVANGLRVPDFGRRPAKPWEGKDYFGRGSDWNVDLKEILGGWGRAMPSLHEMATVCGIPGKMDVAGDDVVGLWQRGDVRRIVQYNECDALTTYLLWLRTAHFGGFLTTEEYLAEQTRLEDLLTTRGARSENDHLLRFLSAWRAMRRSPHTVRKE